MRTIRRSRETYQAPESTPLLLTQRLLVNHPTPLGRPRQLHEYKTNNTLKIRLINFERLPSPDSRLRKLSIKAG